MLTPPAPPYHCKGLRSSGSGSAACARYVSCAPPAAVPGCSGGGSVLRRPAASRARLTARTAMPAAGASRIGRLGGSREATGSAARPLVDDELAVHHGPVAGERAEEGVITTGESRLLHSQILLRMEWMARRTAAPADGLSVEAQRRAAGSLASQRWRISATPASRPSPVSTFSTPGGMASATMPSSCSNRTGRCPGSR